MVYLSLVVEQAIMSAVNAVYLIALGRMLSVVDFAVVGLGFTIFLFGLALYDALISGPMIVLRNGSKEDQESRIVLAWYLHLIFVAVFGILALLIWRLDDGLSVRGIALGFGFLSVASSTVFMRGRLHSESDTRLSIRAAFAYVVGFVGSVTLLWATRSIWPGTAPLPFLVANIAFVVIAHNKIPRLRWDRPQRAHITDHLRYARSSIVYTGLTNLTINLYPALFAFLGDSAAIGGYRLILTTFTPFFQILGAVSAFTIPRLANRSPQMIEKSTIFILGAMVLAPLLFAGLAIPFGRPVAAILFGSPYMDLGRIAPLAYLIATINLALQTIVLWLRANQKLAELRLAGLVSITGTMVLAWPFVSRLGLEGAFISMGLANGFAIVLLLVAMVRKEFFIR